MGDQSSDTDTMLTAAQDDLNQQGIFYPLLYIQLRFATLIPIILIPELSFFRKKRRLFFPSLSAKTDKLELPQVVARRWRQVNIQDSYDL